MSALGGFFIGLALGVFWGFFAIWALTSNVEEKPELRIPQIDNDEELPIGVYDFSYEECPVCECWNLETRYAKRTGTFESPKCELCKTCGYHAHTWFGGEPEILNAGHNG